MTNLLTLPRPKLSYPTAEITTADSGDSRLFQFDILRATEMAAVNCLPWIGQGDKNSADAAACDAIRGMFDAMDIRGEIVIGEGVKDEAPGLFNGEKVGRWRDGTPRVDIAIDPLDGTTNLSKGLPNAISCIAAAVRHDENVPALQFVPAFYMRKLAYPPAVRAAWIMDDSLPLDINAPLKDVIELTAKILKKSVRDVVVMCLDRPRNQAIIEEIRSVGASLRMIVDGDIAAALGPAMPQSEVDLYVGIGGAPEGVLAAVGLRCMGGGMQCQMWPRDEAELASFAASGWSDHVETVYTSRDMVPAEDILFIATGISDSPLLRGAQIRGETVTTHSVMMRLHTGTVRFVETAHDLTQRPLRLRSQVQERNGSVGGMPIPRVGSWRASRARKDSTADLSGVLLFGAPGCGKGTIGKTLGRLPGFLHVSTGDIIRAAMAEKGARGEKWAPMSKGEFISDSNMWDLLDAFLEAEVRGKRPEERPKCIILDGVPRVKSQIPDIAKRVDIRGIFYLECQGPDVLFERLLRRSTLESRVDDAKKQVVETRLRLFEQETLPVLDAYPPSIVHRIDATRPPTEVLAEVLAKLNGNLVS
jgi:fructose-1,6-bisphosphatase II